VIRKPVLWFLQHTVDLGQQPIINGRIHPPGQRIREVNKQVARRVAEVAARLPERRWCWCMTTSYLVPKLVRELVPGAIIQHFVHIPWPTRSTGRCCRRDA